MKCLLGWSHISKQNIFGKHTGLLIIENQTVTAGVALSGLGSTSWFMYYEIFLMFCSDKSTVELTFPSDTEFKRKKPYFFSRYHV